MTGSVFRAVYMSKSLLNKEGEGELLAQAQQSNEEVGITGMFFHHRGRFLQVLEGDEEAVSRLLEKIEADPRHKNYVLLYTTRADNRMFGDWSMASANLNRQQFQSAVLMFSSAENKVDAIVRGWMNK